MNNEQWDYKIDGKSNMIMRIIIFTVISAVFVILTIDQLQPQPNKLLVVALCFGSMAVVSLWLLIILFIRYFCFKVYIGSDGFYFQTNPFNGEYYRYSDIESCSEEIRVSRNRYTAGGLRLYYFVFTPRNGRSARFQFEKDFYEHEIDILKKRIEMRQV